MQDVERYHISDLDPALFKRLFSKRGHPVIIQGLFDRTPSWSVDYLTSFFGTDTFTVREFSNNSDMPKESWSTYASMYEMSFNDYTEILNSGDAARDDIYLSQVVLNAESELYRTIANNIEILKKNCGFKRRVWKNIYSHLWLGPKGHTEPLHSDEGDSTLIQLYGTKSVRLFPSSQNSNLYPFPFFSEMEPWVCQVDISKPDYEKFPRLKEAMERRKDLILNEGELLYIPAQWSHEVSIIDKPYACSLSIMWDIPFARNFISRRTVVWYLLRLMPSAIKNIIYSLYYRAVNTLS
jgi:hypothetical protein